MLLSLDFCDVTANEFICSPLDAVYNLFFAGLYIIDDIHYLRGCDGRVREAGEW